jgi:alanine racemase
VHAANSAATLRDPATHFDMVRVGVAIYGLDPFGQDAAARELEPALALVSRVAAVKRCARGESVGYGRRFVAERDTVIATVPVGYGDGWRRALTNNADVLIGGRRFPVVGTVSMDNVTVDVGPDGGVAVDDEAVLLGGEITAEEIARRLGTINYEVTTGLLPRAERRPHRDGEPADG